MSKKNKIFIACDEANHVCDKSQYKESTLWEKVKLNIHLMYCKACRSYTSKNIKLTKMMKKSQIASVNNATLTLGDDIKNSFKNEFEKALKEHQD